MNKEILRMQMLAGLVTEDEYNTKLKKPIGVVYHYSSDTPHEVTSIISGTRYSVLFYIRTRDLNHKISLI